MRIPTALLRDAVTAEPYLGETADGPKYGTPVTLKARVDRSVRMIRDADGRQKPASSTVFLRPDVPVQLDTRLTVDGTPRTVMRVDTPTDLAGRVTHLEVLVQ